MTRWFRPSRKVLAAASIAALVVTGCSSNAASTSSPVPAPSAAASSPSAASSSTAGGLIPVRFGVIETSGQAEVPLTMVNTGIAKQYGFDVTIVPYTAAGQEYTLFRGGAIDVAGGNILDLVRQNNLGDHIKGFLGFQHWNNTIIVRANSSLHGLTDLAGQRVGEFGTTFFDWLMIRAAGEKAYGFDIQKQAKLVATSPTLLNKLLLRNQIDAALQFSSNALAPLQAGTIRNLVSETALLSAAGFDPNVLYLTWDVSQSWVTAHPGAITKLQQAMEAAYAKLATDDSLWPALAKLVGITSPSGIVAYRNLERSIANPPFNSSLLAPTQTLINAIIAQVGEQAVGFTTLPAGDFIFPASTS